MGQIEWATKIYVLMGIVVEIKGKAFILETVKGIPMVIKVEALKGIGRGELIQGDLVKVTGNIIGIQKPPNEPNSNRRQVIILGHVVSRALETGALDGSIRENIKTGFQRIYEDAMKVKFNNGKLE